MTVSIISKNFAACSV